MDFVRNVLVTIGTVLLSAIAFHSFARLPFAPHSTYRSDPDSIIIATKAALACTVSNVQIAFTGDSSCLMNIDVAAVESVSGLNAVNLGTLSYLGIDAFGMLAEQVARGRESMRLVLVIHPEALRVANTSVAHRAVLDAALGLGPSPQLRTNNLLSSWLGFDDFQARIMERWIPEPLTGTLGTRYGFTESVERELLRRKGTLDETARFDPSTNRLSAEYRLANRIQHECETPQ